MDRKVFFAFVLGVLVVGAPLALQICLLSEQLSGLESQLNDLRNQMTTLIECVPTQVEATAGPIRLTLSLNKTSYWLEESVNITLRIKNEGNETAILARSSPPLLDFVVYDDPTHAIYAYSWGGFVQIVIGLQLGPQESFSMNLVWNQHAHSNYTQIEPGVYFIMGGTAPFTTITVGGQEITNIETQKIPIEIKSVEQSLALELKNVAIEFLNSTDVSKKIIDIGEIRSSVDVDGKFVVIVDYITGGLGHPKFSLDACENHKAVIKLNIKRKVVSALCTHNDDRVWDLLNQRWIQK